MKRRREKIFRGMPVSHGFAIGKVVVYGRYFPEVSERKLRKPGIEAEVKRFRDAVQSARDELGQLRRRVRREMGRDFAEFIDVQLALLCDPDVVAGTERVIRVRAINAEAAYSETIRGMSGPVASSSVAFFKERSLDILDVSARVLRHLLGDEFHSLHEVPAGSVVVAHDLPPSEAVLLDPRSVSGLVQEGGGRTSHTAIMAKAKEIPAVLGAAAIAGEVEDGQVIIVDGYRGMAIVNPTRKRLHSYENDIEQCQRHRASLSSLTEQEAVTLDGRMVDLSANIEFLVEARAALEYGARGVGLFRTEYLFLAKRRPPTEEEQFEVFSEVARLMAPRPVIIRTFDLGGDKILPGYSESNPFLGWRGLRVCFDNPELFRKQLRAILRASAFGNLKVMFPMVSTIEELRRAKLFVEDAKCELKAEGKEFDEQLQLGVMVETPSAALMAGRLAEECSFLSIGSNDLTQYTLAVDRGNERVARLYDQFHPSVLELIKRTIDAAHKRGIWVGLCGEFAADPLGIVVLLGLGIDELSVVPSLLLESKNIIRSIDTQSAAKMMDEVMKLGTALEVRRLLRRGLHRRFPKLAEFLFEFEMEDENGQSD